jgi:hypothetical protein
MEWEEEEEEGYKSSSQVKDFVDKMTLKKNLKKTIEKVIQDQIEGKRVIEERENRRRSQKRKNRVKNKIGGVIEQVIDPKGPSQNPEAVRKRLQRAQKKIDRNDMTESHVGHPFKLTVEQKLNLINRVKEDLDHNILHPLKWLCERVFFFFF